MYRIIDLSKLGP